MKISIVLLLTVMTIGCGEDAPDYSGTYSVFSIRDECPDPADNVTVQAGADGICLGQSNNIECITFTLVLEMDNRFTFTSQRSIGAFGSLIPQAPKVQSGTYAIVDQTITMSPTGDTPFSIVADDSGLNLDWNITTTQQGCDRLYRLRRE